MKYLHKACSHATRAILLSTLALAALGAIWTHHNSLIETSGSVWIRALPYMEELYYFMLVRVEVSMWILIAPICIILAYAVGVLTFRLFKRLQPGSRFAQRRQALPDGLTLGVAQAV